MAESYRTGLFEWVFPNLEKRRHPLQRGGRKAWASTLKKAGLPYFPIYYLRHTFASRLTTAGVSPLTIAQMLGHSSTQIVPRYAQVMDQNRLDAVRKLEELKKSAITNQEATEAPHDEAADGMRQKYLFKFNFSGYPVNQALLGEGLVQRPAREEPSANSIAEVAQVFLLRTRFDTPIGNEP